MLVFLNMFLFRKIISNFLLSSGSISEKVIFKELEYKAEF